MRAFLAIPLQPPALDVFSALREQLMTDVSAVRWAPADSPHITLHFFGTITAHDADRAVGVLRPVLRAQARMSLCLRGLGSFPATARPRVLWCAVDGDEAALAACARAVAGTLDAAGFSVEERPYRAHCTVGRPHQPWPDHARVCWQRFVAAEPRTPDFTADRAILYESLAGAAGVRHVPREVFTLGPGALPSVGVGDDEVVQLDQ